MLPVAQHLDDLIRDVVVEKEGYRKSSLMWRATKASISAR